METQQLLVLIIVALVVAAFAAWILGSKLRNRRRARENVTRLGAALGLATQRPGLLARMFKPKPVLAGMVAGRRIEFYQRKAGDTVLSLLQVTPAARSTLSFELKIPSKGALVRGRPGNFGFNLAGFLDVLGQDVEFGDQGFDAAWRVSTNQPEVLRDLLRPELRHQIMDLHARGVHGTYRFGESGGSYFEYGTFHDEARWQRFVAVAPVLIGIAVLAERHAEAPPAPTH